MAIFRDTNVIVTLSVQNSGACVQRQLLERILILSDQVVWYLWGALVLLDYLATIYHGVYEFLFVGWPGDLLLIAEAIGIRNGAIWAT